MSQNLARVWSEIPPRRQIDCRWTRPSGALRLADFLCFLLYMFLVERWHFFWHSTELVIELVCLHLYNKWHGVTPRRFITSIYILCYSFKMTDQVLQAYIKSDSFMVQGHFMRQLPSRFTQCRYTWQRAAQPSPLFQSALSHGLVKAINIVSVPHI